MGEKFDKDRKAAAPSDPIDVTAQEKPETIQTAKSVSTEEVGEKFDKDRKEAAPRDPIDETAKSIQTEAVTEEKEVPGKSTITPRASTVYASSVKDNVAGKTALSA